MVNLDALSPDPASAGSDPLLPGDLPHPPDPTREIHGFVLESSPLRPDYREGGPLPEARPNVHHLDLYHHDQTAVVDERLYGGHVVGLRRPPTTDARTPEQLVSPEIPWGSQPMPEPWIDRLPAELVGATDWTDDA